MPNVPARRAVTLSAVSILAVAALLVSNAMSTAPAGDYTRALLLSWDGVRRDVLQELLRVSDPTQPCLEGDTTTMPIATGEVDGGGNAVYTCLPALAGVKPAGFPAESPSYGAFQVIASHTTNDGQTMTKPQHASMLSGVDAMVHGLTQNVSITRMPVGWTIYERLMNVFDPQSPLTGVRDGHIFRTQHSADKKFVGTPIVYWAKRNKALQVFTGHGNDSEDRPGSLKFAAATFAKWRYETDTLGYLEPSFFMFLHFKATDWAGHLGGDRSKQYKSAIIAADRKLYTLMEMLRENGWDDAAILITTDHGFNGNGHGRNGGRTVFNTWMAARNVHLTTDHIPMRTLEDYCASYEDPAGCMANGPDEPMPPEDVVPNVYVTSVVPTLLDMFGIEWRSSTNIQAPSLYQPS